MAKSSRQLLKRLETVGTSCFVCGELYGKYSVGCSSVWMGTCGVCGEHTRVTESRDFGYFAKGIKELRTRIAEERLRRAKANPLK